MAINNKTAERQFDVEDFWQKAKSGKVPLALNNKGVVGENCLLRAGVPRHALANVSADIRFVMSAAEQADDAMQQIDAHVSKHPGHLVHKEHLWLSPEAPQHLHGLWNFHLDGPHFRRRLSQLLSRHEPTDTMQGHVVEGGGDQLPAGLPPGPQKGVGINQPITELPVERDTSTREAQRAAAIRAAMERGR